MKWEQKIVIEKWIIIVKKYNVYQKKTLYYTIKTKKKKSN
jgi:hypothetical protein